MNTFPTRSILACAIAVLLAACGGGGGRELVQAQGITPPDPPPPKGACPPPVTGNCVVHSTGVGQVEYLAGGRQSDFALIVGNENAPYTRLELWMGDDSRFSGGTYIRNGHLFLSNGRARGEGNSIYSMTWQFDGPRPTPPVVINFSPTGVPPDGAILTSDVTVAETGEFTVGSGGRTHPGLLRGDVENHGVTNIYGLVDGNVTNHGAAVLTGAVSGNWVNHGRLSVGSVWDKSPNYVGGDFRQSTSGVLSVFLPIDPNAPGWEYERDKLNPSLYVAGRADLEGGTVELYQGIQVYWWGDWLALPLPTTPVSTLVLYAEEGVFGEFDRWISPGLFIEGNFRYDSHDVWFDLNRVSVAATMAAAGARPLAVASAANVDAALARADALLALPAGLTDAQRRFLASASSLLWTPDLAQANRALDSLSGHAHATLPGLLHAQAAAMASRLDARLAALPYSTQALAWSDTARTTLSGPSFDGVSGGVDHWLSPRLLVGGSVSDGQASLHFDRLGGYGWGEAPTASLHLHYRGEGWHATGAVGTGRAWLQLQRPIELGAAGRHLAHSQRGFGYAFAHAELGRDLVLGNGRLVPFVALDYGITRSDGFTEQGDTGFELVAGPSRQARFSGSLGARYAHEWGLGRQQLRLELDARYRHDLIEGDPLLAAFRGVPDVRFALPDAGDPAAGELRVGLGGDIGMRSHWSLEHDRGFGGDHRDRGWRFGLQHAF